jgi:hypothetical protein
MKSHDTEPAKGCLDWLRPIAGFLSGRGPLNDHFIDDLRARKPPDVTLPTLTPLHDPPTIARATNSLKSTIASRATARVTSVSSGHFKSGGQMKFRSKYQFFRCPDEISGVQMAFPYLKCVLEGAFMCTNQFKHPKFSSGRLSGRIWSPSR